MRLSDLLARLADGCRRAAPAVVPAGLLLAALCVWGATQRLGVSTDTDKLFADTLPWRQRQLVVDRAFPQFRDLLVAVIDAKVPEAAEATAAELARRLAADTTHFRDARRPDDSPWFERNGLMFLAPETLQTLLDQTIDAQPFLGQLVADPSARGLFAALTLVGMGVERGEANLGPFAPALAAFRTALDDALAGRPRPLSWERLLAGSLLDQAGPYRFVVAHPRLDFTALEPGGASSAAMRAVIADLPYVRAGEARVRITGQVALNDEEFATVAQGAAWGLLGSVLLVALWLFLAVRTWRLIVPILGTLVLGLALTTGFATVAVGTLNLVSVAFAILFIGIAVDFAIQFSVRYRSERHRTPDAGAALANTARRVGPQVMVAAAATAAGFLAFVPTDFAGVAELGLIAGAGMVIAFASTLTFLPAALALCRPRAETGEIGFVWGDAAEARLLQGRRAVLAGFAVCALAGLAMLPRVQFDSDPLHTKDPTTEAMRTLRDLMDTPLTTPYSAELIAPDLAEADALAARLRALPVVGDALTLSSLVPADQPVKLAAIADAASLLGPTLAARPTPAPVSAKAIRAAAAGAHAALLRALAKEPHDGTLRPLADTLARFADAPDAAVLAADDALVRFLPNQLARLRTALDASAVGIADVPEALRRDWLLPDGRARVQAVATGDARDSRGLHRFAEAVRAVAPQAVGTGVTIVQTAATIVGAFRTAALAALAAITLILAVTLRRALDVALVLAPLLLSALLTVLVVVLARMPLNFANIIALPLLLGVGVSFNIYFVMNWRAGANRFLGTATARAVMFSALTTATAFGSLALSRHPGTASMGALLLISLGCTLLASLVFMPALLRGMRAGG